MTVTETYLTSLQKRVFKLLPMREDSDNGMENHLRDYIDNLCANLDGAFECYRELSRIQEVAEVQSNLYLMRANISLDFPKWRSMVLRSTRLLQTVLIRDFGEV